MDHSRETLKLLVVRNSRRNRLSFKVADIKKVLQTHTDQLDTKVEEAIVRAQTPGPVSEENMSLRGQVCLF